MEVEDYRSRRYQPPPMDLDVGEKEALAKLRIEIQANKNLYCLLEDEFLIKFLRFKNYNVDGSHKMIQKFYRLRLDFEDVHNVPFSSVQKIFETNSMKPLKLRDKGVHILYGHVSSMNLEELTLNEIHLALYLMIDEMSYIKETQNKGCCLIMDFGGLTFAQAKYMVTRLLTFKELKLIAKCLKEYYPIRIKGVYVLNMHFLLGSVYAVLKLFLTEKMRKRIFVGSVDILKNNFGPNILPVSLGGNLAEDEAIDFELQNRALQNYHHFQECRKYGFIDTKRN